MHSDTWPIDRRSGRKPDGWRGWPDNKRFCLVLTHDVETIHGHDKCLELARLEENHGFKSSFNFVPGDYPVSGDLRQLLCKKGFEVGVHGYTHDGSLYSSRQAFSDQAGKINHYLKEWDAVGFRSPAMHHNLEWIQELAIEYDASTFDTDPFEPQPDGMATIFPMLIKGRHKSYIELPYTLPQDFTLFVIMRERGIDVWKKKLEWIVQNGGMALVNTHPDYMRFTDGQSQPSQYPARLYEEFLQFVKTRYHGEFWHVLPKQLARFCCAHQEHWSR